MDAGHWLMYNSYGHQSFLSLLLLLLLLQLVLMASAAAAGGFEQTFDKLDAEQSFEITLIQAFHVVPHQSCHTCSSSPASISLTRPTKSAAVFGSFGSHQAVPTSIGF